MLTCISSREVTLSFYLVTNLFFTNMNEVFFRNDKNCKNIYCILHKFEKCFYTKHALNYSFDFKPRTLHFNVTT